MAMAVRALLVPVLIIGNCLRPLLADVLQSLNRDVQISHAAELSIQPLQFVPYSRPLGVIDHRREKQYGGAPGRKRHTRLIEGSRGAPAWRLIACGANFQRTG